MEDQGNESESKSARMRWLVATALVGATVLAGAAASGRATSGSSGGGASPAGGTGQAFAASPNRPVSFTGTLDKAAVLVGGESTVRMELVIGAEAGETTANRRVPTDLVVILDRSGSMAGDKMENARAAIRELVGQLTPQDRFALVTYSNDAMLLIPPAPVTETARAAWLETVSGIGPDGGTNISSGLDLGLETIERGRASGRVPRAILISDGLANQGDATREGLLRRAGRAASGEYVLTSVGVGVDFNEELMSALADAGTGNYYYLKGAQDLASVFAREFDAARTTVASALEVSIEPGEGVRVIDAAGYPLAERASGVAFRPGALFAGQQRRVWVTLQVPNQTVGQHDLGRFSLAYADARGRSRLQFGETPRVASVARDEEFFAAVDEKAWSRSVVVDDYNKMKEEVAREVKAGRRDQALGALHRFRDKTASLNARIQSEPVQKKLDALSDLEGQVASAFEGDQQSSRQNELSKAVSADAKDERRAGSKR